MKEKIVKNALGLNIEKYLVELIENNEEIVSKTEAFDYFIEQLMLYLDDKDGISERSVRKWINAEAYPKIDRLIAISMILDVSIDQLLKDEIKTFFSKSKTASLSSFERATLKKLLNSNHYLGDCNVLYLPYAFNDIMLYNKTLMDEDEIKALYEKYATIAFINEEIRLNNSSLGKKIKDEENKDIAKVVNAKFLDCSEHNLKSPLYYSNDTEYYEKISKYWELTDSYDVYNLIPYDILHFESLDVEDHANNFDAFYKNKVDCEKKYDKYFSSLIEKNIILPVNDKEVCDLFEDGCIVEYEIKNGKMIFNISDLYNDEPEYNYVLKGMEYRFRIQLTEKEIEKFYEEEKYLNK